MNDLLTYVSLEALQRILGITPAMIRPPYGSYNDIVTSVAAKHGQIVINWDFEYFVLPFYRLLVLIPF